MDMVDYVNRLLAGPKWVREEKEQGIAVVYKDGNKDWFDPVIEIKIEGDTFKIKIDNGNTYDVHLPDTQSVSFYDV